MGKDFILTFKPDSERGKEMKRLFGRDHFEIESFIPELVMIAGFEEPQSCFMLDLKFLNSRERIKLVTWIANKFNLPPLDVDQQLEEEGFPIIDQDVYVAIHNPLRWL